MDPNHCGGCGARCPAGRSCRAGACQPAPTVQYARLLPPAEVVWVDACSIPGHQELLSQVDDRNEVRPLPFAFEFWGVQLPAGSNLNISSNGWIELGGATSSSVTTGRIPDSAAPNNVLAVYWSDLIMRMGVCVATVGAAPTRRLVVEWNDAMSYRGRSGDLTFEAVLYEGTNVVDYLYQTMNGSIISPIGIENGTGVAAVFACRDGTGGCLPAGGDRIRFAPMPAM